MFTRKQCLYWPRSKIFDRINIADNIAIGANYVVNRLFEEPSIIIAEIPARKVANKSSLRYIIEATEIIKKNSQTKT